MKELLLLTLIYFFVSTCLAKLVQKTTDKPVSKLIAESNKPDIVTKDKIGEYINVHSSNQRNPRNPTVTQSPKNTTKSKPEKKKVLVKKPIPKYQEVNSEEDYQIRNRWTKNQDSAEHEDEDFNINDYEFDVNHDEFVSGRKPLEPRTKFVAKLQRPKETVKEEKAPKPKKARSLAKQKNIFPRNIGSINLRNPADKMKEDDYDQEFSTTTQATTDSKREKDDDEDSDEFEDSSEFTRSVVRIVRSPWHIGLGTYVDKLGEKTSNMMTKFLSILPIFPQVPQAKKLSEDLSFLDNTVANPLRGR
ncbi:unnamed protein product [Colias eurytheme]|nr:unnamed protein product [Colias eurytheme]